MDKHDLERLRNGARIAETGESFVAAIRALGGTTVAEWSEFMGVDEGVGRSQLDELVKAGQAAVDDGTYRAV
jgi:hypothetical protein